MGSLFVISLIENINNINKKRIGKSWKKGERKFKFYKKQREKTSGFWLETIEPVIVNFPSFNIKFKSEIFTEIFLGMINNKTMMISSPQGFALTRKGSSRRYIDFGLWPILSGEIFTETILYKPYIFNNEEMNPKKWKIDIIRKIVYHYENQSRIIISGPITSEIKSSLKLNDLKNGLNIYQLTGFNKKILKSIRITRNGVVRIEQYQLPQFLEMLR